MDMAWPFHDVELSKTTTAKNRWDTKQRRRTRRAGVERYHHGMASGPYLFSTTCKTIHSAPTSAKNLWAWYREVLMPRLELDGAIVLMQQRWSEETFLGA